MQTHNAWVQILAAIIMLMIKDIIAKYWVGWCCQQRRSPKVACRMEVEGEGKDLRSVLHLDGTDLVEAPLHDVLALQHELTALALEVLLLPHGDLELTHLLHLLSVHGCCFSRGALQSGAVGKGNRQQRVDGCDQRGIPDAPPL